MALHPKDDRLFVACASSNCVSVIDTKRGIVTETIYHAPCFRKSPEGSTPDALAIAPDGKTLFVANADNNCVAVIDVAEPATAARSRASFRPAGIRRPWPSRPTARSCWSASARGCRRKANPHPQPKQRRRPTKRRREADRDGGMPYPVHRHDAVRGAVDRADAGRRSKLEEYTDQVYRNCPYSDKLLTAAPYAEKTAIPTKVGDPSPIKHVIYIIKENRTYDQVFGDMPSRATAIRRLVMFGEKVTPNHHKLAEEFVLLDNLYCNGHVSARRPSVVARWPTTPTTSPATGT